MAYTKTTWNNLSDPPINADNLNKIEQGIYDNSLGIDKINPSGTATTTAEIEEGQITDVIGFKSLKLKGQTSQYTTTGKNKFDIVNATTRQGTKELTSDKTGFILRKGTNRVVNLYCDLPAGTYTLQLDLSLTNSSTTSNMVGFAAKNEAQDNLASITISTTGTALHTFTTNEKIVNLYFYINNAESENCIATFSDFMVLSGTQSTATSYEPYTGGKASPNPDYPQDVNNVSGDNVIGISNKNIARLELEGQIRGYTNGIPQANSSFNGYIANVKPNTTYVSSCQNISTEYNKISNLCYFDENMNFLSGNAYNGQNKTFTTPANCKYVSMAVNQAVVNFQLEQGSTATSYIAHQGNNFEINLGKNLLNNIVISQTKHGIAFTVNSDKTVYANGTATSSNALALNQVYLEKGKTYFLSGCPSGGGSGKYTLSINTTGTTTRLATDEGNGVLYTPTESGVYDISIGYWYGFNLNNLLFRPQLEKGTTPTTYAPYFDPIELCKIGIHQDYIYKKDGKWYKHKEIGSQTFNGSENWYTVSTNQSNKYRAQFNLTSAINGNVVKPSSNANAGILLCDYYTNIMAGTQGTYGANEGISLDVSGYVQTYNDDYNTNDISLYKTWLASNNITIYWVYATPIEEEITYTPLIRQLDELYNSGLYDVTNISQDNSGEVFILDIEACKNNINGIVEYIRR